MLTYIHLGNLVIGGYGLMIALGLIISVGLGYLLMYRRGLDADDFLMMCCFAALGALAGAKALFLWTVREYVNWSRILSPGYELGLFAPEGFVFLGGFAGGAVFLVLMAKLNHVALRPILENALFVLPLAHAFGRLGCLLGGCCYGIPYDGPLALHFPEGSLPGTEPRFPVQPLSALLLFILALILYLTSRTKHRWLCPWLYAGLYPLMRFMVEFLRGDSIRGIYATLSLSQWLSLALGIGVLALALLLLRSRSQSNA